MLFISIPVHENPEVVLNQCRNFLTYIDCGIVLHVNWNNYQIKEQLNKLISYSEFRERVFLNPVSLKISWGDLFNAHLENLRFLRSELTNLCDSVAFNASNDLLVRSGLGNYINANCTLYQKRIYKRGISYYWWPADRALQDRIFARIISANFGTKDFILGSQIEGSVYKMKFLDDLLNLITDERKYLQGKSFNYPREEIWFPTFAYIMNEKPSGDPFIFSEINKYDSDVYSAFRFIESLPLPAIAKKLSKKTLSATLRRLPYYKINRKIIDSVADNKILPIKVIDHDLQWLTHSNADHIFGVKRIPRDLNNNLRLYISSLSN